MIAALVLGLAPLAAGAADVDAIAVCLDAEPSREPAAAFSACAGQIAERCLEGTSETTLEIAECLARETAAWDALLNLHWGVLRDEAKAAGTFDTLLAAQRAWLAFRDAECAHRDAAFAGGTFRVIAAGACQRDLTARRAIDFHLDLGL